MTDEIILHNEITSLLLHNLNVEVSSVHDDLIDSGLLDSLKIVELVVALESRFAMTIPFEELELEHFRSVASVARLIATLYASIELMNTPVPVLGAMRVPVAD